MKTLLRALFLVLGPTLLVFCGDGAFPIEEAQRLQNLYVVAFFKHHLLGRTGYGQVLTEAYATREPAVSFAVK